MLVAFAMFTVAVVGGGIAGLMAAYRLHERGAAVTLFESGTAPGGVIRSERIGGYLVEHGPNSIQARTPLLESLVRELKLESVFVEASPVAKKRYVVRGGRPLPLPMSPPALLKSQLFSPVSKLRLLREPFIRPALPDAEETVAAFTQRRLGQQWLDYAINPFVAGVFAGDPERLALRHAFPKMYRLEQEHGSLIRGLIRKSRERKRMVEPAPSGRMFSFREGLQTLPNALAARLGDRIRYQAVVTSLRPVDGHWLVTYRSHEGAVEKTYDAVIYAAPLHGLSKMQLDVLADLHPLRNVWYPPVRIVALGYPRSAVRHPLDGFGVLLPALEQEFQILGTLFSSTLFPGRAPEGHVLLTTFVGGARHPDLAHASDEAVRSVVERDLQRLLHIDGPPTFVRQVFWEQAIPQYDVGYSVVKDRIDQLERTHPGFFMAGNYRQGISVADTLTSSDEVARRVAAYGAV